MRDLAPQMMFIVFIEKVDGFECCVIQSASRDVSLGGPH
jgi:hypothetical protein